MTQTRRIVVPIDDLVRLIKDYTAQEGSIPRDAIPVSLQVNPTERGMFGIVVDSPGFTDDAPVRVRFDIKRVYSAGE